MRQVIYSEYVKIEDKFVLEEKGEAIFMGFGTDCQEFNNGVGTFTTAVIELPDGRMKNLPVEQVKFKTE